MPGMRKLKNCPPEDLVWGTLGHEMPRPDDDFNVKRYDAAVRVRPKVTPYAADVGPIQRGTAPAWYVGEPVGFPRSVRTGFQPASGQHHKFCIGSRVAYVDGKQRFVNYLFAGDQVLGGEGLCYWHQLDLATNTMNHYLLILPDDFGGTGYDASLDTHARGVDFSAFYDPFSSYYCGFGQPDNIDPGGGWGTFWIYRSHIFSAGDSQPPMSSRPGAWSAGGRYMSFSTYFNSDGYPDATRHGVARFDNTQGDMHDAWYAITSTIWDDTLPFALVRPSIRSYERSTAESPDEPWWIAYDRATNRLGTGRWRSRTGPSLSAEIERVIPLPNGAQVGPNILCYNRLEDGRDLILVRDAATVFPGGAGGERSGVHWIYDGDEWFPIGEAASFVTADKEGNILYGGRRLIRKLGANGWSLTGTGEFGPADGGPYIPPNEPAEDPESSETPIEPEYNSPFEEAFQILCSKSWIQVRNFYGDPGLASSPLESAEWPEYTIADRTNSRNTQAIGGDLFKCWSFSYDGSVRVPHVQFHAPYVTDNYLKRIHWRMYVGRNPSEPDEFLLDGLPWIWPTYAHTGYQCDWDVGMEKFKPWIAAYDNPGGTGIQHDTFIDHAYNYDFDIVDVCECCCSGGAVSY